MRFIRRGKVLVNKGYHEYKKVRVIAIDCNTKRPIVETYGSNGRRDGSYVPIVILSYDPVDGVHPANIEGWTEIEFPEFRGWSIISATVARYTLNITFVKF